MWALFALAKTCRQTVAARMNDITMFGTISLLILIFIHGMTGMTSFYPEYHIRGSRLFVAAILVETCLVSKHTICYQLQILHEVQCQPLCDKSKTEIL